MIQKYSFLLAAAGLALAPFAKAAPILDTGTPNDGASWAFEQYQYFAAEFTVGSATTISSIEGYLANDYGSGGNVQVELLNVGADGWSVGSVVDSTSFTLGSGAALDWYGVSGLNWDIAAGNYWAAFIPDSGVSGSMPGYAPSPAEQYVQGSSGNWENSGPNQFNYIDAGVRVNGDATAPDGGATVALLGAALVGLAAVRRKFVGA